MAKKLTSAKAKEILHDKSVHGHPLTDKQRKFFGAIAGGAPVKAKEGWLEKYAEGGVESRQAGYTDIPFNYNSAWGGQFAMGGSLPGAVGFTYARTYGAAPSNGPYAKKTLPSAQDGIQNGKKKGNPISDWWYNLDDVQGTYKMYNDLDPFLKNWYQNPETQRRLKQNLQDSLIHRNTNPSQLTSQAINTLQNTPAFSRELVKKADVSASDLEYNNELQGWKSPNTFGGNPYFDSYNYVTGMSELGSYDPDTKQIIVNSFNLPGTIAHEGIHGAPALQNAMEDVINWKYYNKKDSKARFSEQFGTLNWDDKGNSIREPFEKVKNRLPGLYSDWQKQEEYLNRDGMYPRIMDIRRTLNLKPGQKVDKSILENESISHPLNDLKHYYDEDIIIDMLNTLAKNDNKKTLASAQDGKNIHSIDLGLPKYEKPKPFFTGYGFSQNPATNVNVHGVGIYGTGDINDRLNLSGNINSASVFYPGGKKIFMNPRFEVGMKYKFDNGGSMSYYQHGLDWKPRNISRDGSEVPKNQNAKFVLPKDLIMTSMPRAASESTSLGVQKRDVETEDKLAKQKAYEKYVTNQPQLKSAKKSTPQQDAERRRKNKAYASTQPNVGYDEQTGNTYAINPNMTYSGEPANFMGERQQKAVDHILGALEAAGYAEGLGALGSAAKKAVVQSMESGLLSNTYKLNPFAEKLANPNKSYRVAGMDAAKDFEATGVLRSNPTIVPANLSEGILGTRTTPFPSFQKGYADLRYLPEEGGVIFETDLPTFRRGEINPVTGNRIRGSHYAHRAIDPTTGKVLTEIPGENVRMFEGKPNWLRGYKEVPKPTSISSSVENKVLPKITSEQWKEMSGYLERRQFIKGLQKEGLVGKEFNIRDINYAARSTDKTNKLTQLALDRYRTGYRGVQGDIGSGIGIQESGIRNFNMNVPAYGSDISEVDNMIKAGVDFQDPLSIAKYQATHVPMESYGYRSGVPDMYKAQTLYTSEYPNEYGKFQFKVKKPTSFSEGNYQDWFNKYYKDQPKFEGDVWENLVNKGEAPSETINFGKNIWIDKKGTKVANIDESFPFIKHTELTPEQKIEYNNYLEKLKKDYETGWRGQYKKGGVVKDDNGYWNPDNWGKVVEIDSSDITMQGVDQPLLGISDTGDVQYMEPGKDYKFKGKKVREYPVGKNGVNMQDQKVAQQLDQLTNFTNYNKPTKGGWLEKYK